MLPVRSLLCGLVLAGSVAAAFAGELKLDGWTDAQRQAFDEQVNVLADASKPCAKTAAPKLPAPMVIVKNSCESTLDGKKVTGRKRVLVVGTPGMTASKLPVAQLEVTSMYDKDLDAVVNQVQTWVLKMPFEQAKKTMSARWKAEKADKPLTLDNGGVQVVSGPVIERLEPHALGSAFSLEFAE